MVRFIFTIAHTLRKKYWKFFNIQTRGVRVLMLNGDKVLLVRHRYNNLYVFPGGALAKDEDMYTSAKREVFEETGYVIRKVALVLGEYTNTKEGKHDHVTVLVTSDFAYQDTVNVWQRFLRLVEVQHMAWFSINALPKTISKATAERITEFVEGKSNCNGVW